MRLQSYILEGNRTIGSKGRSERIITDKAIELLNAHCKTSLRSTPIYRGVNHRQDALFIDPSKHIRRSEYADNYYMLLFQLMPSWKDYPSLAKSVIMVSDESDATSWSDIGQAYRVYPYEGHTLGVCPKEHFWGSFLESHVNSMDNLNEIITGLLMDNDIELNHKETDPTYLKKAFDQIEKMDDRVTLYHGPFKLEIEEKILDVFDNLLDPDRNGFKHVNSSSIWTIIKRKQVWTEAPCVMINTATKNKELRKYL